MKTPHEPGTGANTGLGTSSLNRPRHCSLRMLRVAQKKEEKKKTTAVY